MTRSHILLDMWFDNIDLLKQVEPVKSVLIEAVKLSGARIVHHHFHQFEPYGFSGFVMISESHVSVHTWAEEGFMAVDILTCDGRDEQSPNDSFRGGSKPPGGMDSSVIVDHLKKVLKPSRTRLFDAERG